MRDLMAAYYECVGSVVRSHSGFIAKYLGDGVLLYFGYPAAREDDAEQAVRAGLAIVQAVQRLDWRGERLSTRIGIATGVSVVGDLFGPEVTSEEHGVVGETPNMAARLQALATPNTAWSRRIRAD